MIDMVDNADHKLPRDDIFKDKQGFKKLFPRENPDEFDYVASHPDEIVPQLASVELKTLHKDDFLIMQTEDDEPILIQVTNIDTQESDRPEFKGKLLLSSARAERMNIRRVLENVDIIGVTVSDEPTPYEGKIIKGLEVDCSIPLAQLGPNFAEIERKMHTAYRFKIPPVKRIGIVHKSDMRENHLKLIQEVELESEGKRFSPSCHGPKPFGREEAQMQLPKTLYMMLYMPNRKGQYGKTIGLTTRMEICSKMGIGKEELFGTESDHI